MESTKDNIKVEVINKKSNEVVETKYFNSVRSLEKFQYFFINRYDTTRFKLKTWC